MATIKDVALKAGVTVTTVSRVLNNRGYISQATREKVYRVMEEMQYQPNEIARALMRKRSMMLGMIVPTIAHPFFGELAHHVELHASARGYKLLICNSRMNQHKERVYIDMLESNRVDGIIMGSHTMNVDAYTKLKQPIVAFDRVIPGVPSISSDNYRGGVLAAELLLSKGCRRIAHVCGKLNPIFHGSRRTDGFRDALAAQGVEPYVMELGPDDFDNEHYEQALHRLFDELPNLDGLFASSDMIALHAVKICAARGITIPGRLKLVGYDDIQFASIVTPGITTLRQPLSEMSELAVGLLDRMASGEDVPGEHILPVRLVERGST
ncbi:LacI family DNA-binding transcriptional regulator [Paenibacillus athensensis]|uniref:LacI family transcriptional regulator n=1 Tax=Paenibacillus athensensis TaxID=1967502 RepID=A0A4Y8PTK1_9BACL|nr:LacI family DNA-binding transcriptional regulator [Paenibacillus athensensis]MCD1258606.1 LacI family DNA-binding transcriptional regulator [Paenibacillus athensensis]